MKKVLYILVIIVLLFGLSGCNNYRYNKFNENLEFDEELDGEEYADLIKKVVETWSNFSTIKMKTKSNHESAPDYTKINSSATIKAYSNSIIQIIGYTKQVEYKSFVKTKNKYVSEEYDWDCKEENEIVKRGIVEGSIKYETSTYKAKAENPFESAYLDILNEIQELIGSLTQTKAYKTKNGYVFIKSEKEEQEGVRIDIPIKAVYEAQTIYVVNKDYEITKILYYVSVVKERLVWGKWTSKLNGGLDSVAIQFKISYGRKQENLKLEEKLNKEYQEYLNNNRPL